MRQSVMRSLMLQFALAIYLQFIEWIDVFPWNNVRSHASVPLPLSLVVKFGRHSEPGFDLLRWLKVVGSVALMACYVLPMSSCTRYVSEDGDPVLITSGGTPPPGVRAVTTRQYLVDEFQSTNVMSWLRIGVFSLPLLVLAHTQFRPSAGLSKMLWYVEPLLLVGVLFAIWYMLLFHSPDVGSYVAWIGVAIYFCGWAAEASQKWKARHLRFGAAGRDA